MTTNSDSWMKAWMHLPGPYPVYKPSRRVGEERKTGQQTQEIVCIQRKDSPFDMEEPEPLQNNLIIFGNGPRWPKSNSRPN